MSLRRIISLSVPVMMAVAGSALAAPPSMVHTAQDLLDLCADPGDAARAACKFYIHGAIQSAQLMRAADSGQQPQPIFCPPDAVGVEQLVATLRSQVSAHPERAGFPAPTVILGGGLEAYPCPKAAAPAHTSRRRHR